MGSAAGGCGKVGVGAGTAIEFRRRRLPSVLVVIGLLLLTAAFLLGAPQARAAAGGDTHTWNGGAGEADWGWSNSYNWVGGVTPSNGDDLVFPEWSRAVNDDFLASVGSIDIGVGTYVGGSAVTMAGSITAHMDDDFSPTWDVPTTLTGDAMLTLTPIGNPTGSPMTISQDLALQDGSGAGHSLTVDAGDASRATVYGQLSGSDSGCSLIKQGTGSLKLGDGGWTGSNTWAGPTDVQAGALIIGAPGALSCHTAVHIADGARVTAALWFMTPLDDVWNNEFSGDGGIEIDYGGVTFTGTSPSFAGTLTDYGMATIASGAVLGGTADAASGGTLYGLGTVEDLTVDSGGTVNPGLGDFGVGQLSAGGEVSWNGGGSYAADVSDAGGAAGDGYDSLVIGGAEPGLSVASSEGSPFTIFLVSSDGSTAAQCGNFDNTKTYCWHVATLASGGISGWDVAKDVKVDSTQFATYNDLGGGTFDAEPSADGTTVDVVFTPGLDGPKAGFGNALSFGQGYLQTPNGSSTAFSGSSDYTLEMWVRPAGVSGGGLTTLARQKGWGGTLQSWLILGAGNRVSFGFDNIGTGWYWSPASEVALPSGSGPMWPS